MKSESVSVPTGEQLRVTVAELCGWTDIDPAFHGDWGGFRHDKFGTRQIIPDYPNDLNACAELLKIVREQTWHVTMFGDDYGKWVCLIWKGGVEHRSAETELSTAICIAFVKTMESTSTPKEKE